MSEVLEQASPARAVIDGAIYLPLALLAPSSTGMQTRRRAHFDKKKLDELADSIKKHGVLQPILVRAKKDPKAGQPLYEIVAGERRWRASTLAKVDAIPAIVREISDFDSLELQVIENLQRDDLHPLEEAEGYEALMRKPDGIQGYATVDELAARIGKSRSYVFGRLKLCALIDEAKKAFIEDKINASVALLIARMPASVQAEATKKIVQGWGGEPMAYRASRDYLEREFMLKLGSAPFKITDETLVPAAGSCTACGKRTGANPDLFDDVHADVCTDSTCFAEKKAAHQARLITIAKAEGREVITGAAAKKVKPQQYGSELNGYLKLDEVDYRIDGSKPLSKLLGKDAPPTALLEDPHTHELIKVVRRDDAMQVLKDKGIVKSTRVSATSDSQRKAEAKVKAETAWRTAVAQLTVAAIVDQKFDEADVHTWLMPEIAIAMWDRLDHDTEKVAMKLLAWENLGETRYSDSRDKKLSDRVRKLTAAQVDQMFVAMAIAGQTRGSTYGTAKPERLLRIAKNLAVDVDQVRADIAAATKAKKTPAKKVGAGGRDIKYRHPETGETWSGRGQRPKWIEVALERSEYLLEDLAVAAPAAPAKKVAAKKTGTPATPKQAGKGTLVGVTFEGAMLRVGDQLRVKKTATGRKTAKDGRVGKVDAFLEGGSRITLRWGSRAHEVGVYGTHELERIPEKDDASTIKVKNGATITADAAWPFPTGARA